MANSQNQINPEVILRRRWTAIFIIVVAFLTIGTIVFLTSKNKVNNQSNPTIVQPTKKENPNPSNGVVVPNPPEQQVLPSADYCSNNQISVFTTPNKFEFIGEEDKPEFTIVVTNISNMSCKRDLGTGVQKVAVSTIGENPIQVWANSDCSFQPGVDIVELQPGQQATFKASWTRFDSVPNCSNERKLVLPGEYVVTAFIGDKMSEAISFTLK